MEDWPKEFTTVLGAIIAAIIGAVGLWWANRFLGRAAFQTSINSGFKELTDQLQEERREMLAQQVAERMAVAQEREQMRGEIRNLVQVVESLKRVMRDHNIPIPDGLEDYQDRALGATPVIHELPPTRGT